MRKLAISALAVIAVGATFAGAKTARAERWISSNWNYVPGYYPGLAIPGGFTVNVHSNDAQALGSTMSIAVTGTITNSQFTNKTGNCSGTTCPTTHWAFTLCGDNTFITGPIELDYNNSPRTVSWTGNTTGFLSGRWTPSWGPVGNPNGMCADLTGAIWLAGGVWVYEYGPQ